MSGFTSKALIGVYPIVVLTHRTHGNLCAVESIFRDMGVERIFAFENYTKEDHFKTRGRHEEVLKFLQEVIRDVQFKVEQHKRNPETELSDRKKFVLNYLNDREKRRVQEEIERNNAIKQAIRKKELEEQQEAAERENQRRKEAYEEAERKKKEEYERRRSEELKRMEAEKKAQEAAKAKKKGFWEKFKPK